MKKWIILFLVMELLCGTVSVPAGAEQDLSGIFARLGSDRRAYLSANDAQYACQYESLGYALTYCESRSWPNLIRTRAASLYAKKVLDYYGTYTIEPQMTNEDYRVLNDLDFDLGDCQTDITLYNADTPESLRTVTIPRWETYLELLMDDFFRSESILTLREQSECVRNEILCLTKFLFLVNNFTLLEFPAETAQEHLAWCRENIPFTMSVYPTLFTETNDVLIEMNNVMNELKDCIQAYISVVTELQVVIDHNKKEEEALYAKANELTIRYMQGTITGEEYAQKQFELYATWFSDLEKLKDLSPVLPYPKDCKLDPAEIAYYWKDAEGKLTEVTMPFRLDILPNCSDIRFTDGTAEGFAEYVLTLKNMGMALLEESDTAVCFRLKDGSVLSVSLSGSDLTIHTEGTHPCFLYAPYFYTEALTKVSE